MFAYLVGALNSDKRSILELPPVNSSETPLPDYVLCRVVSCGLVDVCKRENSCSLLRCIIQSVGTAESCEPGVAAAAYSRRSCCSYIFKALELQKLL